MMISGIVQYEDHSPCGILLAQQPFEEAQESGGVEDGAHHAHELARVQADGAETSHGLAGRRMLQDGVFDFRRHPHAAARTVLLEVTFIQAPQLDVGTASQTAKFFLLPQLSADPTGRLEGVACVPELPQKAAAPAESRKANDPRTGQCPISSCDTPGPFPTPTCPPTAAAVSAALQPAAGSDRASLEADPAPGNSQSLLRNPSRSTECGQCLLQSLASTEYRIA